MCPNCNSKDIKWDSWNATGHCKVQGINLKETAIGYQLWCDRCKANTGQQSSFAATSHKFWVNKEHWEIPRELQMVNLNICILMFALRWHTSFHSKRCSHSWTVRFNCRDETFNNISGPCRMNQVSVSPFSNSVWVRRLTCCLAQNYTCSNTMKRSKSTSSTTKIGRKQIPSSQSTSFCSLSHSKKMETVTTLSQMIGLLPYSSPSPMKPGVKSLRSTCKH